MADLLLQDPLPPGWSYCVTEDGRIFFVDDHRGVSTWLHPDFSSPIQTGHLSSHELPLGYEYSFTPEGAKYFIDHKAWITMFEEPVERPAQDNQQSDYPHPHGMVHPHDPVQPHGPVHPRGPAHPQDPNYSREGPPLLHPASDAPLYVQSPTTPTTPTSPNAPAPGNDKKPKSKDPLSRNSTFRKSGKSKVHSTTPTTKRAPGDAVSMAGWINRLVKTSPYYTYIMSYTLATSRTEDPVQDRTEAQECGSILLPSYKLEAVKKEMVTQPFTFKITHENMKTNYFSADTPADFEIWTRAFTFAINAQHDIEKENEYNNNKQPYLSEAQLRGDSHPDRGAFDQERQSADHRSNDNFGFGPNPDQRNSDARNSDARNSDARNSDARNSRSRDDDNSFGDSWRSPANRDYPRYDESYLHNPPKSGERPPLHDIYQPSDNQLHHPDNRNINQNVPDLVQGPYLSPENRSDFYDPRKRPQSAHDRPEGFAEKRNHSESFHGRSAFAENPDYGRNQPETMRERGFTNPDMHRPDYTHPQENEQVSQNRLDIRDHPDARFEPEFENREGQPLKRWPDYTQVDKIHKEPSNVPLYQQGQEGRYSDKRYPENRYPDDRYQENPANISNEWEMSYRPKFINQDQNDPQFRDSLDQEQTHPKQLEAAQYAQQPNRHDNPDYPSNQDYAHRHDNPPTNRYADVSFDNSPDPPYHPHSTQQHDSAKMNPTIQSEAYTSTPATYINITQAENSYHDTPLRPPLPASYRHQFIDDLATSKTPNTSHDYKMAIEYEDHHQRDPNVFQYPEDRPNYNDQQQQEPQSNRPNYRDIPTHDRRSNSDLRNTDPRPPSDLYAKIHRVEKPQVRQPIQEDIQQQDPAYRTDTQPMFNDGIIPFGDRRDLDSRTSQDTLNKISPSQKYQDKFSPSVYNYHPQNRNDNDKLYSDDPRYQSQDQTQNRGFQPTHSHSSSNLSHGNFRNSSGNIPLSKDARTESVNLHSRYPDQNRGMDPYGDQNTYQKPRSRTETPQDVIKPDNRYPPMPQESQMPSPGSPPMKRPQRNINKQMIQTVQEEKDMLPSHVIETKSVFPHYPIGSTRLRMSLTADNLLGKSHEELILLLIQLRRTKAGLEQARDFYRRQLEKIRDKEMEYRRKSSEGPLTDTSLEQHHFKYTELKSHSDEIDTKLEVYKPLINLVDNMVTMGSVYGGNNYMLATQYKKHLLRPDEYTPPRRMLEFSRHHQEDRMVEDLEKDKRELTEEEANLEEKTEKLYDLDRECQQQAAVLGSLKEDKNLLEQALADVTKHIALNRDNPRELDSLSRQQRDIENELARAMQQLADASKKLEETSAENRIVEHEVALLRSSQNTPTLSRNTSKARLEIEKDLARVGNMMAGLSQENARLTSAVGSLLPADRLSSTGSDSLNAKSRQSKTTYYETDIDCDFTIDIAIASPDPVGTSGTLIRADGPLSDDPRIRNHEKTPSFDDKSPVPEWKRLNPKNQLRKEDVDLLRKIGGNDVRLRESFDNDEGKLRYDDSNADEKRDFIPRGHHQRNHEYVNANIRSEMPTYRSPVDNQNVPRDGPPTRDGHLRDGPFRIVQPNDSRSGQFRDTSNLIAMQDLSIQDKQYDEKVDPRSPNNNPDHRYNADKRFNNPDRLNRNVDSPVQAYQSNNQLYVLPEQRQPRDQSPEYLKTDKEIQPHDNYRQYTDRYPSDSIKSNDNSYNDENIQNNEPYRQGYRKSNDDRYHDENIDRNDPYRQKSNDSLQSKDHYTKYRTASNTYPSQDYQSYDEPDRNQRGDKYQHGLTVQVGDDGRGNRGYGYEEPLLQSSHNAPAYGRSQDPYESQDNQDDPQNGYDDGTYSGTKERPFTMRDMKRQSDQRRDRPVRREDGDTNYTEDQYPNHQQQTSDDLIYQPRDGHVFTAKYAEIQPTNPRLYENVPQRDYVKDTDRLNEKISPPTSQNIVNPNQKQSNGFSSYPQRRLGPKPFTPYVNKNQSSSGYRKVDWNRHDVSPPKLKPAAVATMEKNRLPDHSRQRINRETGIPETSVLRVKKSPRRGARYLTISSSQPLSLETPIIKADIIDTAAGDLIRPVDMIPDIVRSSTAPSDYHINDIDKELLRPDKVNIPERYVPDVTDLTEDEKLWRQERSDRFKKLLTSSSIHDLSKSDPNIIGSGLHQEVNQWKREREQLLGLNQQLARQVSQRTRQAADRGKPIQKDQRRIDHKIEFLMGELDSQSERINSGDYGD